MGYNRVTVKWKKAKNATSYVIYYKQSSAKKWLKLKTVSSKATSYVHKASKKYPLKQGVKYSYRVRAYNKTIKKYGAYSKAKTVKMPKKAVVTPQPTITVKPTATPKPTVTPMPTAAPKPTATPIPNPTAIPKPTQIPQPTKPVQPAKPTATPIPKPTARPTEAPKPTAIPQPTKAPQPTTTPRPTATPAPTATPKPVKVSSITLSQTSLTLTTNGQTASLTATVNPDNAANKNITWSSSDSSIATVNANGTVTAIANGTADITVTAADGSGVSAKCSVTVRVPNNITTISLEGGKSKILSIWNEDYVEDIDVSKVTFEYNNSNDIIDILGYGVTPSESTHITIKALRKGAICVKANYNGHVLRQWDIQVTSDWQEYLEYVTWRKSIENKIWSSGMSVVNKLDAAKNFIQSHYGYQNGAGAIINVYNGAVLDCYGATELMSDFAKDIGLSIKYVNAVSGHIFDYSGYAFSEGGHVYPKILINGNWVNYDATPLHS